MSSIEQLPVVNSLKDLLNPELLVENTYLFATLSIFLARMVLDFTQTSQSLRSLL